MITKSIGNIGNYYGGLLVTQQDGKYYWIIDGYDNNDDDLEEWEEIDKELYDKLIAHKIKEQ